MHNLRTEIKGRYGSVHNFCKQHQELNRATVYQLLAGTYGGNRKRQTWRIQNALNGQDDQKRAFQAIKQVACSRCHVSGECKRCDELFDAQAKAAMEIFSS